MIRLGTFQKMKAYATENTQLHQLTDQERQDIQQTLLETLRDLDDVCEKYHLTYYLTGGSALGAVRHGGFIPWDDDADVSMPRKDYDALAQIYSAELAEKYDLQSLENSQVYDLNFMKLRRRGTKYIELFETEPERAGIALDIYPLDETYDSRILQILNGIVDEVLYFIASCVRMYHKKERLLAFTPDENLQKSIRIKCAVGRLFDSQKDPRKWFLACDRWNRKKKDDKGHYVATSCGRGHYFGEIYEKKRLFPVKRAPFDNMNFNIPYDSDYLLRKLYGNAYMQPICNGEAHSLLEYCGIDKEKKADMKR